MDFLARMLPPREWDIHLRNTQSDQMGSYITKAGESVKRELRDIANRRTADIERMLTVIEKRDTERIDLLTDFLDQNIDILSDIRAQLDYGFRAIVSHLEYQSKQLKEIIEWLKLSDRAKNALLYAQDGVRYFIAEPPLWQDAYEAIKKSLDEVPKNPFMLEFLGRICLCRTDGASNPSESWEKFKEAAKYGRAEIPYSNELMISIGKWGALAAYLCEDYEGAVTFSCIAYEHAPNNKEQVLDYARYLVLQRKEGNDESAWNIIWKYLKNLNDEQYNYILLNVLANPELYGLLLKRQFFIEQEEMQKILLEQAESISINLKTYYDRYNIKYPSRLMEIIDRLEDYHKNKKQPESYCWNYHKIDRNQIFK